MRVTPNSSLQAIMSNLRKAQEVENQELERLSSGKRIIKAQDDSAGLALSKKMDAFTRSQRQAQRNANDGISFVQTAEGGLNEVGGILVRLRELSIQGASDTVGNTEREMMDQEYQELILEVDRIAQSTSFNGTNVINGSDKGTLNFQVGAFKGESAVIEFETDSIYTSSNELGINGTTVQTKSDSVTNLEAIDEAITHLSSQRASLGALQSRMQSAVNNLEISIINHEASRSKIEDLDVAESSAKLAANTIVKKAAISTLSQAMDFPKAALKLID